MIGHLEPRFRMHGMQRPRISATVSRPDGLFMAISRAWEVVHEADLNFEDAAGRCAQVREGRVGVGRGLFMAISRAWEVVHEADLKFEDAAGR